MKKRWLLTKILFLHYPLFRSGIVNLNGVDRTLKSTPVPVGRSVPRLRKMSKILINFYSKMSVKEKTIAERTKLRMDIIYTTLHKHLNLSNVSARWMLRMLTAIQIQVHVECCNELLKLCSENSRSIIDQMVMMVDET